MKASRTTFADFSTNVTFSSAPSLFASVVSRSRWAINSGLRSSPMASFASTLERYRTVGRTMTPSWVSPRASTLWLEDKSVY
jgi:hypothetical protein